MSGLHFLPFNFELYGFAAARGPQHLVDLLLFGVVGLPFFAAPKARVHRHAV